MTPFSRKQAGELKWVSTVLFLAALYNVAWGALAMVAPGRMPVDTSIPKRLRNVANAFFSGTDSR